MKSAPQDPPAADSDLHCLFAPRSVAVVGASNDEKKRGNQAIRALQAAGFAGRIVPVNPKGGTVCGLEVATSLDDLDGPVDLALVCTPAATVPGVLEACVENGIGGAVILALGFREAGAGGALLETRIHELVASSGLKVVGPNTSGLLNPHKGLNLIGVQGVPAGNLALLVQSGNMGLAVIQEAVQRSAAGFSAIVGVGNEAGVTFDQYLDHFADDPATACIAMYVEGFRDGATFLQAARRVSRKKPIVLLKGGRSLQGRAAARSHTGAVAGSYPVFRAGMKASGVLQVRRSDELFHVAQTLADQPRNRGRATVAILTDGGGHGTLAVDALRLSGTRLAELHHDTLERLREVLGTDHLPGNPVDLAGAADGDPMAFARCVEILAADDGVGAILVAGLFGGYGERFSEQLSEAEARAAAAMSDHAQGHRRALVVHSLYAHRDNAPLRTLREQGVPVIGSLEIACRCVATVVERGTWLRRREGTARESRAAWSGWPSIQQENRTALLETEARELVAAYGVKTVPATMCTTAEAAAAAVERHGRPCALKVVAGSISHKSDADGVALGIASAEQARDTFARIRKSASDYCLARGIDPDFRGVLVSPMMPSPIAELIVGYKRDPQYGGVLIVGLGGIAVEVLKDITLRLLPLHREDAYEMLGEIKANKLLRGHRGKPPVDREALVDLMLALGDCVRANPEIVELEANPVFAYEAGAVAVDVRAIL